MYVVLNGEIIGKAKQEKVNSSRLVDVKVEEPTTIYLSKAVANGETVQYYTKMKPEKNQSSQKLHAKKRRIKQINQLRMTTTNKIKVKWIPQLKRIKIKKVPKRKNQIKRQLQKMVAPQKNNSTGTTKTTVSGKATLPKTGEQQNRLLRSLGMALLVTVMGISYILKRKNRIKQD